MIPDEIFCALAFTVDFSLRCHAALMVTDNKYLGTVDQYDKDTLHMVEMFSCSLRIYRAQLYNDYSGTCVTDVPR